MSYDKLRRKFNIYLNDYIQINGIQTVLQIRQLTKNYAIEAREGRYDLTAKKYYCSLFTGYLLLNNIPFPEGWTNDQYDPDNEFINDPNIQRLRKKWEKNVDIKTNVMINNIINNN
jgi:hypothetical protein